MHEQEDQCYAKQMQAESCKHVYVLLQQYHLRVHSDTEHILWPVTHVTHQSADPWPAWPVTHDQVPDHSMRQSRLLTNHDEFTLLPSYFCNLEFWIWLLQYIYSKSSIVHSCYKLNTVNSSLINLLHVYTLPNHGSSILRYWHVTQVTHSHLSTH